MLILLDIDGVMVPANSWRKPQFMADGFPEFSRNATQALQRIIAATDASLLLTTSHKLKYSALQWRDIFELRGIRPKEIQQLSSNSLLTSRTNEILIWYAGQHTPALQFAIIDDDKLLNELPAHIKTHLVLTSPSVGLTDELANLAISILQKNNDHH